MQKQSAKEAQSLTLCEMDNWILMEHCCTFFSVLGATQSNSSAQIKVSYQEDCVVISGAGCPHRTAL